MKKLFTLLSFFIVYTLCFAQSNPPKREFRAAWVATVVNLDWPSSPGLSVETQKSQLINLLDNLALVNVNAVVFQVRPECDAFYDSAIEPWSYWLTGQQGTSPNPFYDPLEFAIEEAHRRGMELHAWFNPYRAVRSIGNYAISPNHVSVQHPDWVITIGDFKFLNPGLPMVREYVTDVVMDVVNRYDVDGVHFDDYFYPYPPNQITTQDLQTFQDYPRGFTNIGNWRRDNVNILIAGINDSIQAVKPYVRFGISPFGIWKSGTPPGIFGLSAYSAIYCDAVAWLQAQSIDYLTPQVYWPFGGSQDYGTLVPWWSSQLNGRHLYPGQAYYRASSWPDGEILRQIRLNRVTDNTYGSVFFRAQNIPDNPKGTTDSLMNDYYRYKAISPNMSWKDQIPPNEPLNARFVRLENSGSAGLVWEQPAAAPDGEPASRYIVYGSESSNIQPGDLDDPANILSVVGNTYSQPQPNVSPNGIYYLTVTSLDRNFNESGMSNIVEITPPDNPLLALPSDGASDQPFEINLKWYFPLRASSYQLQVASDQNFNDVLIDINNIPDTMTTITGLEGQQTYYWKVKAFNLTGSSNFSNSFSFTTGFPVIPVTVYPPENTPEIPLNFNFIWNKSLAAETYAVQVAKGADFSPGSIVVDTVGLIDTILASPKLELNRFYFWRTGAFNSVGFSGWGSHSTFKTTSISLVADDNILPSEYVLRQNYPNPFNPQTKISFSIPERGYISLRVFNILGELVSELVNEELNVGNYTVTFDGSGFSSGVYLYMLRSNNKILTGKMMLVK